MTSSDLQSLHVVCGIVIQNEIRNQNDDTFIKSVRMLLGKRSEFKRANALLWEFFGGKIEQTDSSKLSALRRELKEELGADAQFKIQKFLMSHTHRIKQKNASSTPTTKSIELHVFLVQLITGVIKLSQEHTKYQWFTFEQIDSLIEAEKLSPADIQIVHWFKQHLSEYISN